MEERIVSLLKDEGELHGALAEVISEAREIETAIAEASSLAATRIAPRNKIALRLFGAKGVDGVVRRMRFR